MNEPRITLYKFGEKKYMNDLILNGHLYLRSVQDFREYKDNNLRGDENEGINDILQPKISGRKAWIKLEGEEYTELTGLTEMKGSDSYTLSNNLYCMYADIDDSLKFDEKIREFGDTYVRFDQTYKFLPKLDKFFKSKNYDFGGGLVEYVDKSSYDGEMGLSKKFSDFSYQSEYRVRVRNTHKSREPISVFLGNLSEYASIGSIDELF